VTATAVPVGDLMRALDLAGVFGNAVLGGVVARRAGLDPVGFATLAVVSGLGGGMIRDTLLQHSTPVALTDYAYLLTALVGAALAFLLRVHGRVWERVWLIVDALALGCWAAAGAQKALDAGLGWLPAVLLGTITAVGGGVVRDIMMGNMPGIFGGNTLYATCAIAASAVLVVPYFAGQRTAGLLAATATGAALCWLARWRGWMLPSADAWSPARVLPAHSRRRRAVTTKDPAAARPDNDDPNREGGTG
jgi:uncharacterized membrane protein YeiH